MQARFLPGPAGSGKTWRCLAEIRAALAAAPDGPPLILLAPKQATFQLERQLLETGEVPGWSRLFILSFERLANFVLEALARPPARLLPAEGRVMVLRALLDRLQPELEIFRGSARLAGFAQELGDLVREFRRHGHSAARLAAAAERLPTGTPLAAKLRDLARLLAAYDAWLTGHALADADTLPDLAAATLREAAGGRAGAAAPLAAELWLDGFAEMTPQELGLLAALAPFCIRMNLSFCVDPEAATETGWLSPWNVVAGTYRAAQARLAAVPGVEVRVEPLPRSAGAPRFAKSPSLGWLEANWCAAAPAPFAGAEPDVRLLAADDAEGEAVAAARGILAHVRAGGRFRDCAVLLRSLDGHHDAYRRVFTRYEIPCFLDRREPLAHHPLAELTRGALRTAVLGWRHEDWFGALKSGLAGADDETVDELENEALARGLDGDDWLRPWPGGGAAEERRSALVAPFAAFHAALGDAPDGVRLADALRALWAALKVAEALQRWAELPAAGALPEGVHRSAWEQLQAWADGVALGFGGEPRLPAAWLPVLEAGLSGLTAGIIPPAQDQVLVGAVDRARQPELRLVILAGFNDGLFPAAPAARGLLTEAERGQLAADGLPLGPDARSRLGHERYYAYIAFTRSRGRLVITQARRDAEGRALNPSPYLAGLRRILPGLVEEHDADTSAEASLHACELAPWLVREPALAAPGGLLRAGDVDARRWVRLAAYGRHDGLSPSLAARLAGPVLRTSATKLEAYAACPFRYLAAHLLGASPRETLEPDARREGTLRHEILRTFTERWRAGADPAPPLSADIATGWLRDAAATVLGRPQFGFWRRDPAAAARAAALVDQLGMLARVQADWTVGNFFRPDAAELRFGPGGTLPAWRATGPDGRAAELTGSVDRLDVWRDAAGRERLLVFDYKTTARKPDDALADAGIELQLALYLGVLEELLRAGGRDALPAGAFYAPLRPDPSGGGADADKAFRQRFRHDGFAAADVRPALDASDGDSGQFVWTAGRLKLAPADLAARLAHARDLVVAFTGHIFAGDFPVAPYRHRGRTACDHCDLLSVCRHDPVADGFRRLAAAPSADGAAA
ncbi:MAG: PD-(D/E)XK nuclease family protein [Limisphaerales bacterium]